MSCALTADDTLQLYASSASRHQVVVAVSVDGGQHFSRSINISCGGSEHQILESLPSNSRPSLLLEAGLGAVLALAVVGCSCAVWKARIRHRNAVALRGSGTVQRPRSWVRSSSSSSSSSASDWSIKVSYGRVAGADMFNLSRDGGETELDNERD